MKDRPVALLFPIPMRRNIWSLRQPFPAAHHRAAREVPRCRQPHKRGKKKRRHVQDELGFDAALDHRAPGVPELLPRACPHGIDIFGENVGGLVFEAGLPAWQAEHRRTVHSYRAKRGDSHGAG